MKEIKQNDNTKFKYIQITAGRGPVECARVVTLVARELIKATPTLTIADSERHNQHDDCYMSLTLVSNEPLSAAFVAEWEGTVQWTATRNSYRPGHKRVNWFVGISFFDEVELPTISDGDIVYESCRSGGKGGQNVNKVETAVRAVHLPTGLSVKCSDQRSQHQNKVIARQRLMLKLHGRQTACKNESRAERWTRHDSLERGNPIKKFRGPL